MLLYGNIYMYAQILEEMRQWRRVSTTDSDSGTTAKGLTAGAPHLKVW
jgi:SH3-like domain-containing protein